MAKYKTKISPETVKEAEKMAKATQRPGQTKEQTKLIAQGIQKGIEQYKKQFKSRSRELDKKLKSIKNNDSIASNAQSEELSNQTIDKPRILVFLLPWSLLIISWICFFVWHQ